MTIKKIYSINIVYFDLGHGKGYVYHGKTDFKNVYDRGDILELSEKQQNLFGHVEVGDLYPEYYVLKINKFNDIAKTTLDEWVYFLKHDRIKNDFKAKGLLKALEILDYSRLSSTEKAAYDYEQDAKSRYLSEIFTAKHEGRYEMEEKYSKIIEEKDEALKEKDKALEEKDESLKEKDNTIEEQAQKIEALQRLLDLRVK